MKNNKKYIDEDRKMQLTNNWWMLLWLFGVGGILIYLDPVRPERVLGKTEYRWSWMAVFLLTLPYVIWAGCRTYFGDTQAYIRMYQEVPNSLSQIGSYLLNNEKDRGFSVFSIVMKSIIGNSHVIFFMIIAIVQMWCLVSVYRKYSTNFFLSFFLFVASTDYLSWMHNGMRQFLAVTVIFACFRWIVEKRYVPLIIVILLMSTIHGSALMMIPIVFIIQGKPWNKKTILFILGIVVAITFIDKFTPFLNEMLVDTQYSDLITNEIWTNDDGTSILRTLVYSVPALLSLVGIKYVNEANDPVINVSVNASIVSMALYFLATVSSGIYIGRLPIYVSLMSYIALPWLIDNMFTKNSARLVKMIMMAAYLVFFYYQMFIVWA